MMRSIIVIYCLLSLGCHSVAAQLEGLWEVQSVSVGEESMTPVGKWFRFLSDGTYTSGNGWLQNDAGTWLQDIEAETLWPKSDLMPADPAGPFTVKQEQNFMTWTRQEEGMTVTVHLTRIDQLPTSPPDQIVGLWQLQSFTHPEKEITTVPSEFLQFQWDHLYRHRTEEGQTTGFWVIHGHRPDLSLLPHNGSENRYWKVRFENKQLVFEGNADGNRGEKRVYVRTLVWPE